MTILRLTHEGGPELETHACPACGSRDLAEFPHPLYRTCSACRSIVQVSSIEDVQDYYEDRPLDFTHQIRNYRKYLALISRVVDTRSTDLVDIGTGDGTFLETAAGRFRTVHGCDTSPKARKLLRARGRLLDPAAGPRTGPRVVTCSQVIEHQREPREFLEGLDCRQGDWLVVTAPAADGPNAIRHRRQGSWAALSPSHHVCLYSRKGLESLLVSCGMQLVFYGLVWAGGQSLSGQTASFVLECAKWPVKVLLGRRPRPPVYSGIDSFLAIARPV